LRIYGKEKYITLLPIPNYINRESVNRFIAPRF